MSDNSRPYNCQRALAELQLAFSADSDRACDMHLWLFELRIDHCRKEVASSPEWNSCVLASACATTIDLTNHLGRLTDSKLLHLWQTISDDVANETPGEMIREALMERGMARMDDLGRSLTPSLG